MQLRTCVHTKTLKKNVKSVNIILKFLFVLVRLSGRSWGSCAKRRVWSVAASLLFQKFYLMARSHQN